MQLQRLISLYESLVRILARTLNERDRAKETKDLKAFVESSRELRAALRTLARDDRKLYGWLTGGLFGHKGITAVLEREDISAVAEFHRFAQSLEELIQDIGPHIRECIRLLGLQARAVIWDEQQESSFIDEALAIAKIVNERYKNIFSQIERRSTDVRHQNLVDSETFYGGPYIFLKIAIVIERYLKTMEKIISLSAKKEIPEGFGYRREIENVYRVRGVFERLYAQRFGVLERLQSTQGAEREDLLDSLRRINAREQKVLDIITDADNRIRVPEYIRGKHRALFDALDHYFNKIQSRQEEYLEEEREFLKRPDWERFREHGSRAAGILKAALDDFGKKFAELPRTLPPPDQIAKYLKDTPKENKWRTYLLDTPVFVELFLLAHSAFAAVTSMPVSLEEFVREFRGAHAPWEMYVEFLVIAELLIYFALVKKITDPIAAVIDKMAGAFRE